MLQKSDIPYFSFHSVIVEFIVLLIDEVNKVDDYIYSRIVKHFSGMECYLYAQPLNLNTEVNSNFGTDDTQLGAVL